MDEKTLCPAAVRAFDGKESPQNFSMMSRLSKDATKSIGGAFFASSARTETSFLASLSRYPAQSANCDHDE